MSVAGLGQGIFCTADRGRSHILFFAAARARTSVASCSLTVAPARSQRAVCAPQAKRLQKQLNIPNGYFLTKRMAELFMLRESAHLPVAIVRPSLVGCVGGLPQPGCADCRTMTWCRVWLPGGTSSSTRRQCTGGTPALPCQADRLTPHIVRDARPGSRGAGMADPRVTRAPGTLVTALGRPPSRWALPQA